MVNIQTNYKILKKFEVFDRFEPLLLDIRKKVKKIIL